MRTLTTLILALALLSVLAPLAFLLGLARTRRPLFVAKQTLGDALGHPAGAPQDAQGWPRSGDAGRSGPGGPARHQAAARASDSIIIHPYEECNYCLSSETLPSPDGHRHTPFSRRAPMIAIR